MIGPGYKIHLDAARKEWEEGGGASSTTIDWLFETAVAARAYFKALSVFASVEGDTVLSGLAVHDTEKALEFFLAMDRSG